MEKSKKLKTFCRLAVQRLKSTKNVDHFNKKDEPDSLSNLEFSDSERRGYLTI